MSAAFACASNALIGRWYSDREFTNLAFELRSDGNIVFADSDTVGSGMTEAAFRLNLREHKLLFRQVYTDGRVVVESHTFKVDGQKMTLTRDGDNPSVLNTRILYRK